MKRSNRHVLTLGLILAVVAFGGIRLFGGPTGSATPAPVQRVAVVTAAQDLEFGLLIADEGVATIQMAMDDAVDAYRNREQLVGLIIGRHAHAGEALSAGDASFPVVLQGPAYGTPDGAQDPAVTLDEFTDTTTVKVLVQNVQVLATTMPTVAAPDGASDPDTGQPIITDRLVILGVSQQAQLIRVTQIDGGPSLLLRSPQDATSADVTTTGMTQRPLVDEHGVLPPRVVIGRFP